MDEGLIPIVVRIISYSQTVNKLGVFISREFTFSLDALPYQEMVPCGQKLVWSKILGKIFIFFWEFSCFSFFPIFGPGNLENLPLFEL